MSVVGHPQPSPRALECLRDLVSLHAAARQRGRGKLRRRDLTATYGDAWLELTDLGYLLKCGWRSVCVTTSGIDFIISQPEFDISPTINEIAVLLNGGPGVRLP